MPLWNRTTRLTVHLALIAGLFAAFAFGCCNANHEDHNHDDARSCSRTPTNPSEHSKTPFSIFPSFVSPESHTDHSIRHMSSLSQTVKCTCGKVQLAINSPSVLRLVCYCKDCRGYINTLNGKAETPTTPLDSYGGVDWTSIYPSEIKVSQGQDHMSVCKIRDASQIRRVYASCCNTPLFNIGGAGFLLNTNLVDEINKPDVRFRIMGRQALKGDGPKPKISWSVPLSWFWTMPGRINKDKMEPTPIDISAPKVLDGFKQG